MSKFQHPSKRDCIIDLEKIPLFSIVVRCWKFLNFIFPESTLRWRAPAFVAPACVLNMMQFAYLFSSLGNMEATALNLFFATGVLNSVMRTCFVIWYHKSLEDLFIEVGCMYTDIIEHGDMQEYQYLHRAVKLTRAITIFNMISAFCDILGVLIFPLLCDIRLHPFGVAVPGLNMTKSPIYEIFYIMQLPTPVLFSVTYMPFVCMFASFTLFGKASLQVLKHRLSLVCRTKDTQKHANFVICIQYYFRILRLIENLNAYVTYIVAVEFTIFTANICMLLFSLTIVETFSKKVPVLMYIITLFYVLITYYWLANELIVESITVSDAVYDMAWYDCNAGFRKIVLIFMMITQRPLMIKIGNVYPMTLATFQSLVNASYSYFTMLNGITDK